MRSAWIVLMNISFLMNSPMHSMVFNSWMMQCWVFKCSSCGCYFLLSDSKTWMINLMWSSNVWNWVMMDFSGMYLSSMH